MLSSFMASFCSMLFMVFMVFQSSLASPTYHQVDYMKFSTISAAPALLPGAPLSPLSSSPTPSPDITPLFPSPGGVPLSPSQSSLPTIPSSPSPPNPDHVAAPGPDFAFPPSGTSLPASSSVSVTSSQPIKMVAFLVLVVVCTMWLSGM